MLGSTSPTRRKILENAGVHCTVKKPEVDEDQLKNLWKDEDISTFAPRLADAKALALSQSYPAHSVIGSDQTLILGSRVFNKSRTLTEARKCLLELRNKTHLLQSSVTVAKDGKILWSFTDRAKLTMRDFTENFLDDYIEAAGEGLLSSVGAYKLEGMGIQLFEKIEGDYFTILGLPLLPLLTYLRQSGHLPT